MNHRPALLVAALAAGACGPAIAVDDDGGSVGGTTEDPSTTTGVITITTSTPETSVTSVADTGTVTGPPPSTSVTTSIPPPPVDCPGVNPGGAGDSSSCSANEDCESGVCNLFEDAPPTPTAVCIPTPAECQTWVTGTVRDINSTNPVVGADVRIVKVLDAITNPAGAPSIGSTFSDDLGRVDLITDGAVDAPFGILATSERSDYSLSATAIAAPDEFNLYDVGIVTHEFWAVPTVLLELWSDQLAIDPGIPPQALPLGEAGGVVGIVRDAATGTPVPGSVVYLVNPGSSAVIRYLQGDGTFNDIATGTKGVFVGVGFSATGEEIDVVTPDNRTATGSIGSANGIVFTLSLDAR